LLPSLSCPGKSPYYFGTFPSVKDLLPFGSSLVAVILIFVPSLGFASSLGSFSCRRVPSCSLRVLGCFSFAADDGKLLAVFLARSLPLMFPFRRFPSFINEDFPFRLFPSWIERLTPLYIPFCLSRDIFPPGPPSSFPHQGAGSSPTALHPQLVLTPSFLSPRVVRMSLTVLYFPPIPHGAFCSRTHPRHDFSSKLALPLREFSHSHEVTISPPFSSALFPDSPSHPAPHLMRKHPFFFPPRKSFPLPLIPFGRLFPRLVRFSSSPLRERLFADKFVH